VDLRFWHLHRGMDLSFVEVSGFFFVTTERTVDVVLVVVLLVVTNNVVERTYVGSWLLTDASFWIRRVFIRVPV